MKKKLFIFLTLFFMATANVNAKVADTSNVESGFLCMYSNGNGYKLNVTYYYNFATWTNLQKVSFTSGKTTLFDYDYDKNNKTEYTATPRNFFANYDAIAMYDPNYEYYASGSITEKINDPNKTYSKSEELCPQKMVAYKIKDNNDEEQYQFLACESDSCNKLACEYDGATQKNCKTIKQKAEELKISNSEVFEMSFDDGVVNNNEYYNPNKNNFQENYNNTQLDKEKYCDEESSEYNKEKCEQATEKEEYVVETATSHGTEETKLKEEFLGFKSNISIDFNTEDGCESYLGNPKLKGTPAYYLQFAFNLIKYIAIIMLLVLTIVEYAKAVVSSNQDAIKKATMNTVKRLILAAVIFMLPMLIEFLFKVLGLYSSTTCGIK